MRTALFFLIFYFLISEPAKAAHPLNFIENYDNPISFKVEVLPWEITNDILPKGTVFTIIDVETGLQFKVQRRAGRNHADVQPLTKKDTKIMKMIYNGRWSWQRKAIIVLVNDQMIAGSMHGMPHGAGALTNGFRGHFCIHFLGSTTHRSRKTEPLHQLMILKAGGKLDEYIDNLTPAELITVFSHAVNLHDMTIIHQILDSKKNDMKLKQDLNQIIYMSATVLHHENINDTMMLTEIPVKVELKRKNQPKERNVISFVIRRSSLTDRWYLDGSCLEREFNPPEEMDRE
ncbi:hypothetical protein D0469_17355 [Peribacillus saganii]|uniref:Uncharacterized protein n=1 Tax=Peribacillus saganii TaxID=2303992 RepID=A0A372LJ10_9BACI|nr:hypothetical protein [Peribacillus saganii]RFU66399.1 hypothetical protein D0469_17355 [Peribacillus saganii]